MVQTFSKPQEARELEARARAKRLGVRIAVVSEARQYVSASQSQPGIVHTMQRTAAGFVCSCDGFMFTGCCKHLGAVERRAAREGWDFGSVCPLHRAAKYFPVDADTAAAAVVAPAATVIPFRQHHNPDRDRHAAELYG
jgi:hypothetical protein